MDPIRRMPLLDWVVNAVFYWKQEDADNGCSRFMEEMEPGQAELIRDFAIELAAAAQQHLKAEAAEARADAA